MAVYLGQYQVSLGGLTDLSGASIVNNQNKTVNPSTSQQTVTFDSGYTGLGTVTITAMPGLTLPTLTSESATSGYTSKATIGRSTSDQYINIGTGYNAAGAYYKISAVPNGTAGTPTATKGTVSNHSISVTPSVTNTTGYITGGTKTGTAVTVTASELASGNKSITSNGSNIDVVGYSTVSVNVSGGGGITPTGNLDIIESGTIDVTNYATVTVPVADASAASASIQFITENSVRKWRLVYEAYAESAGWVDEGGFGTSQTYKYNAVPANTTITPSTSSQTIGGANYMMEGAVTVAAMPSGTAGTPSASKGTVSNHSISVTPSVTNTTGYITGGTKTGTAVTVSASELVSGSQTFTSNNTYDVTNLASVVVNVSGGGGGGTAAKVGTATATPTYASASISFTGLLGEPTSFAVVSNAELATGASPWKTAAVVYDGTDLHGQTIRNTSNAQVTYDGSSFSYTYNNGTLTITGSGTNFQANQYKLVYTYGSATVGTAQTQVGSGATSITFTGVTDEPAYFSCIFKSNFSTSSGYQRVIVVANDGTSTYGMEMDSSAKVSTVHWSYNYNNGSLTITSQGTNAGGYFHQPGYYQLTYVAGGGDEVILQDKTVSPTESTQYITADEDYTGLGMVTVNAISSTYVGSGITQRSSTDLTASGALITAPSGYYSTVATYTIRSKDLSAGNITLSLDSTTGIVSAYASITSAQAGYYGSQTTGNKTLQLTLKDSDDLTVSGATVTAPAGYYSAAASKSVASMTLPTAAATSATSGYTKKATIGRSTSTQYINIGTGYNSAGGYYEISAVANGSASAPTSISGTTATVSTGTNTLTLTKTVSVTPVVSAGYVSSGTATNSSVSLTASVTVDPTPTASGATITIPAGYYTEQTTKSVTTMTLPTSASSSATSGYTKKATISRSTSTQYINIAPGYNSAGGYYEISAVANGSATGPTSLSGSSATITTGTNTITLTKTNVTTTPTVSAGYVSSATASTATVTLTASVTTKAAATYHPSTTVQSISSGTYLTGAQTIAAVTTSNLSASNIVSGVTIKVGDSSDDDCVASVTGNVVLQNYYTGSSAPSSSLGSNGDLYLQS